jgi:hypothetical protein
MTITLGKSNSRLLFLNRNEVRAMVTTVPMDVSAKIW